MKASPKDSVDRKIQGKDYKEAVVSQTAPFYSTPAISSLPTFKHTSISPKDDTDHGEKKGATCNN